MFVSTYDNDPGFPQREFYGASLLQEDSIVGPPTTTAFLTLLPRDEGVKLKGLAPLNITVTDGASCFLYVSAKAQPCVRAGGTDINKWTVFYESPSFPALNWTFFVLFSLALIYTIVQVTFALRETGLVFNLRTSIFIALLFFPTGAPWSGH